MVDKNKQIRLENAFQAFPNHFAQFFMKGKLDGSLREVRKAEKIPLPPLSKEPINLVAMVTSADFGCEEKKYWLQILNEDMQMILSFEDNK
jgi:hypothetical protein